MTYLVRFLYSRRRLSSPSSSLLLYELSLLLVCCRFDIFTSLLKDLTKKDLMSMSRKRKFRNRRNNLLPCRYDWPILYIKMLINTIAFMNITLWVFWLDQIKNRLFFLRLRQWMRKSIFEKLFFVFFFLNFFLFEIIWVAVNKNISMNSHDIFSGSRGVEVSIYKMSKDFVIPVFWVKDKFSIDFIDLFIKTWSNGNITDTKNFRMLA